MMMNYMEFKKSVMDNMPEYLKKMDIQVHKKRKDGQVVDALIVSDETSKTKLTMYINHLFLIYLDGKDLEEVLKKMEESVKNAFERDVSNVREKVIFQLVNTEQNKETLASIPHREFEDLSIIYRQVVKDGNLIIDNSLAKSLGMEEEEFFNIAMTNTRRIYKPIVKTIDELIRESLLDNEVSSEDIDHILSTTPMAPNMWVISNEKTMFGAVTILYPEVLDELANTIGDNLYILPSSIHEVIAVNASGQDPLTLSQMVTEINLTQVEVEDRLSNNVYYYDRSTKVLALITDSPVIGLDY